MLTHLTRPATRHIVRMGTIPDDNFEYTPKKRASVSIPLTGTKRGDTFIVTQ